MYIEFCNGPHEIWGSGGEIRVRSRGKDKDELRLSDEIRYGLIFKKLNGLNRLNGLMGT